MLLASVTSSQSTLNCVSACGENFVRSLAPPIPTKPEERPCGDPFGGPADYSLIVKKMITEMEGAVKGERRQFWESVNSAHAAAFHRGALRGILLLVEGLLVGGKTCIELDCV